MNHPGCYNVDRQVYAEETYPVTTATCCPTSQASLPVGTAILRVKRVLMKSLKRF